MRKGYTSLWICTPLPEDRPAQTLTTAMAIPGYTIARASRRISIAVWQRIAGHYKDNPTVLGYDLLNEPIPHYPSLAPLNAKLEPVYRKLTTAIRQVDTHHILFLGGAQWDSNFSVFHQPFDNNTAYTFHKYWSKTDVSVIQQYLDFRDRYNVPIWMGESGENTDEWITQFVDLLNKNDIGWTFWPYKKDVEDLGCRHDHSARRMG